MGGGTTYRVVTGKSLDSPEKGNVDQNVRKMSTKMSEKCPKNCPKGLKPQFSDIFWTIFAYLVDALVLVTLSNARPLQRKKKAQKIRGYPPFFNYYVINSEKLLYCNCNVILILINSKKLL